MENKKSAKFDIDIEIKELLWEFLRRWRIIVVLALICGIMLVAYQYSVDMQKTDVPTVKKSQEELEKAMGEQDLDEVTAAVALKRQLDQKSAYMETSELMKINPYDENVILLQYYVETDSEMISEDVVDAYISYIDNGYLAQMITEKGDYEQEAKYIAELISIAKTEGNIYVNVANAKESTRLTLHGNESENVFDIKVVGKTLESAIALSEDVQNALQEYQRTVSAAITGHQLILVEEYAGVQVDQSLAELQNWNATAIKTISNNLDSMKNEMTSDQISLYVYRTTTLKEETNVSAGITMEPKVVQISIKHAVIGVVIGIVLAFAIIFVMYLFAPALRNSEEVKILYKVKVIGTVNDADFQKKPLFAFVDKYISNIMNAGKKKMSYEQQVQMAVTNIVLDCKSRESKEVFLVSSIEEKVPKKVWDDIVAGCEKKGIHAMIGKDINCNAASLEAIAKVGNVVFVEKKRLSLYDELYKEVSLCRENMIQVLGMIVLGA